MLASLIANPLEAVLNTIAGGPDSAAAAAAPLEPQGNATFTEDVLRMMMYNLFQGDSRLQQQVLQDYYSQDVAFSLNGDLLNLTGRDELQQLLRGSQLMASYKPEILEISSNAQKAVILMRLNVSYKMLPLTWWAPVHLTTTITLDFGQNPNFLAAAAAADHADLIIGHHQELSVVDLFWWNPAWDWFNKKIWSRVSGRTLAAVYQVEEPIVTKFSDYLDNGAGLVQASLWSLEDLARSAGLQGLPSAAVKLQLIPSRANSAAAAAAAAAAPATAAEMAMGYTEAPRTPTKAPGSAAPPPAAAAVPSEAPPAAAAVPEQSAAANADHAATPTTGFVDNAATASALPTAADELQQQQPLPPPPAAAAAAARPDTEEIATRTKTRWDTDSDKTLAAAAAAAAPDTTRWDEAADSTAAAAAEPLPVAGPPTAAAVSSAAAGAAGAAAEDSTDVTDKSLAGGGADHQVVTAEYVAEVPLPATAAAESTTELAAAVAAGLQQITEESTSAAAGDNATPSTVVVTGSGRDTVNAPLPAAAAVDQTGSSAFQTGSSSSSFQDTTRDVAMEAGAAEAAGLKVEKPQAKQQQQPQEPALQKQGSKGSRKHKRSSSSRK